MLGYPPVLPINHHQEKLVSFATYMIVEVSLRAGVQNIVAILRQGRQTRVFHLVRFRSLSACGHFHVCQSILPLSRVPTSLDVDAIRSGSPSAHSPAVHNASRLLSASKRQPWTRGQRDFRRPPVRTDRRTHAHYLLSIIIITRSIR